MPRFTHWTPWQRTMASIAVQVVGEKYTFADYRRVSKAVRLKWWYKEDANAMADRLEAAFPEQAFPYLQIETVNERGSRKDVILRIFPLPGELNVPVPLFGIASLPKLLQLATKSQRQKDYRKVIVKTALNLQLISLDDSRDPAVHDWKWVIDRMIASANTDPIVGPQLIYAINEVLDTESYLEIDIDQWEKPNADVDGGSKASV